jgi:cystine transport system permease protein
MDLLAQSFPLLLRGLGITLLLGFLSFVLGCVLGGLIVLARISRLRPLRGVAIAYVSVFRGTPLLIQIMLVYYGLPQLGVDIPSILAAVVSLTLYAAAYLSENFRAGILAVDRGQWEAAQSMGMRYPRMLRRIVLPQAARVATPPVGSRFIALMKDTSLASAVTVVELTRVAESVGTATFRYMEAFLLAGFVYWLINALLSAAQGAMERRLERAYT